MNYLVGTNVLLRIHDEDDARHDECTAAVDLLRSNADSLFVCAQVLAELRVVSTRPRDVNGLGLDFDEAVAELADARGSFPCLAEPPDMADRWQQVVTDGKAMGRQAHDARLVALMLAHRITHLLTLNPGDFSRYAGITAITPQQITESMVSQ